MRRVYRAARKENRQAWGWLQTWRAAGTDARLLPSTHCFRDRRAGEQGPGEQTPGKVDVYTHTHTHTHTHNSASCCRTLANGSKQCSSKTRLTRAWPANTWPQEAKSRLQPWNLVPDPHLLDKTMVPQAATHSAMQTHKGGAAGHRHCFTTEFLAPSSGVTVF